MRDTVQKQKKKLRKLRSSNTMQPRWAVLSVCRDRSETCSARNAAARLRSQWWWNLARPSCHLRSKAFSVLAHSQFPLTLMKTATASCPPKSQRRKRRSRRRRRNGGSNCESSCYQRHQIPSLCCWKSTTGKIKMRLHMVACYRVLRHTLSVRETPLFIFAAVGSVRAIQKSTTAPLLSLTLSSRTSY